MKIISKKRSVFLIIILCGLFGCTLEPNYEAPSVCMSDQWKNQESDEPLADQFDNWWDVFEDPVLACFMKKAIESNQDLIAAQERVEQARDLAKIAKSKLFPWFNLSFGYDNQEVLTQIFGPNLPHHPFVLREHQVEYALPLTMSYEVDLWGKIRSAYKSAKLNAAAKAEAYNAGLLIVTTELGNAYFQLRILDALADVYAALIDTRKNKLEINVSRFQGEVENFSDSAVTDQDLNLVEARYFEIKQRRAMYENMIAALLGVSASDFNIEKMPLLKLPPNIPQGIPAQVLSRRPDLAELERMMESIHALLGVAYAAYFPTTEIEAGAGFISPLIKHFFKSLSHFWRIGANLTETIFDAGARYNKLQLTWSQYREAVANYRQGVLTAFQEVETTLSNLQWISKRMESVGQAIEAAKIDYKIASDRYKFGVDSYLPATDKKRDELDNEVIYLDMLGFRYLNTVQLIRAMGGGW